MAPHRNSSTLLEDTVLLTHKLPSSSDERGVTTIMAKDKSSLKAKKKVDEDDVPQAPPPGGESAEEKLLRRKEERRKRRDRKRSKKVAQGVVPPLGKQTLKKFSRIFNRETEFVAQIQQALPEVRNPSLFDFEEEVMEDYLLDDEGAEETEAKRQKLKERTLQAKEADTEEGGQIRALSYEQLKARSEAKRSTMHQEKNEKKRARKKAKFERKQRALEEAGGKKKFVSKANPNLQNQQKGQSLKDKPADPSTLKVEGTTKTPLRKKPVVKSNGEIVYSKFDFISEDKRYSSSEAPVKTDKLALLKQVQKTESRISSLEGKGKAGEAASLVASKKWDSALRRAKGEKIRDDSTLLKKSIKKMEKKKQVSKKKWTERLEKVGKAKAAKQEKRSANIAGRREEKVKRVKKIQRKKGRIA